MATTSVTIVLLTVGVLGLGALEIWLFWMLGQRNDRQCRRQATASR
jgi:hypothetical protein